MSVLCKFSSSSGVNHPTQSRVGLSGCGRPRSVICKIPQCKQKQTSITAVGGNNLKSQESIRKTEKWHLKL